MAEPVAAPALDAYWTAGDILLDQQESQDISGSEINLDSSTEKDLQIEIEDGY